MIAARIGIACVGFFGAIFLSAWVPAICIVLLCVRFRAWEAILLGLFMDLLWLGPHESFQASFYGLPLFTIGAIIIVWAFEPLRREFLSA
jgi:hypothetical protein